MSAPILNKLSIVTGRTSGCRRKRDRDPLRVGTGEDQAMELHVKMLPSCGKPADASASEYTLTMLFLTKKLFTTTLFAIKINSPRNELIPIATL